MKKTIHSSKTITIAFIWILFLSSLFYPENACTKNLLPGVILANDRGEIVYEENSKKKFIPASILKILTSLTAIHVLGGPYHFSTDYYFDKTSKNLYIKGYGDPLFISEVVQQFCQNIISTYKIDKINNIVLDQTYFTHQIQVPGKGFSLNPYDAPVGALCANFNTIMFEQSPKGDLISAEPQTPLLPIFQENIKKTGLIQGRIVLTKKQSHIYPGLLIKYFLETKQIKITGNILQGSIPSNNTIQTHSFLSPFSLKEVIQKLLKFSNNFIANQLLLAMGAKTNHPPATIKKGLDAIYLYLKQNLKIEDIAISEGSGLSKTNQISPEQMLKILIEFMPHHSLLNKKGHDYYKTGTLTGVKTRVGYLLGKNSRLYPYVIMVNQKNKGYAEIQNKLLNIVRQRSKNE
ncbi:MAG: D-alanyl-D-alanine carboxypeptidase [Desulfobacteraceae bacterium]|nr:D-alanyl-D-alanine carboxypeptidase [Desulfobacteraceae bacterium]